MVRGGEKGGVFCVSVFCVVSGLDEKIKGQYIADRWVVGPRRGEE